MVDEDVDLMEGMAAVIQDRGYRAVCVASDGDALSALETELPALILVGLSVETTNGAALLASIRRSPALSKIPRVIMTACNDLMITVREDVPVLYKPFDADMLTAHLRRYSEPLGTESVVDADFATSL
ncbi:MAG: response regulator [Myxococcales bacterium]